MRLVTFVRDGATRLGVIATGTPDGVGAARTPQRFLRPGDTVRVEIEGLGVLENPVVAEA